MHTPRLLTLLTILLLAASAATSACTPAAPPPIATVIIEIPTTTAEPTLTPQPPPTNPATPASIAVTELATTAPDPTAPPTPTTDAAPGDGTGGGGEFISLPLAALADPNTEQIRIIDPTGATQDILLPAPNLNSGSLTYATDRHIFYLDRDAATIFRLDPTTTETVAFPNLPTSTDFSTYLGGFVPAPDGERLALAVFQANNADFSATADILLIDRDGTQSLLYQQAYPDGDRILQPIHWSRDGRYLYVSSQPFGIGGYILFWGASSVLRLDVTTSESVVIFPEDPACFCPFSISPDSQYLAWIDTREAQMPLYILDLLSLTTFVTHPLDPAHTQAGSIVWSPFSNALLYTSAAGDVEAEVYSVVRVNLDGSTETLLNNDPRLLESSMWFNDTLVGYINATTFTAQIADLSAPDFPIPQPDRTFWIENSIR